VSDHEKYSIATPIKKPSNKVGTPIKNKAKI
jgi:hypothetical protein